MRMVTTVAIGFQCSRTKVEIRYLMNFRDIDRSENGIRPFKDLLILKNIDMTLLRRILSESVFRGHTVLSAH